MWKDKLLSVRNYIVKHCKILFPVFLVAVVAITVCFALKAGQNREEQQEALESSQAEVPEQTVEPVAEEVPLAANEDSELHSLIATYYNAIAMGDEETLRSVCDEIENEDMLRIVETAKYIDYYPTIEIYTKPGFEEGSTIAFVYYRITFLNQEDEFPGYQSLYICTDEQGKLYIKKTENSQEVKDYIQTVSSQADVVEFNNRVTVEYNELMAAKPELLQYMYELASQVEVSIGVQLAKQNEAAAVEPAVVQQEETPTEQPAENQGATAETPEESGPQYATATTTVNVRSSDSEQADKLGKVTGGERVEVQEVRVNGWTKIVYEGKDGYIKSEYLQMAESAADAESIGTVKATTNINVRSAASETAERLGVLTGGETAELIENADGWCKIKYNGQIGYVKVDYVEQN